MLPAAQRCSVHPRHDGYRAAVDGEQHVVQPSGIRLVVLERQAPRRALPADVGASAEDRTVPGEDHGAQSRCQLVRQAPERLGERGNELGVERVAHLGTRQRDPRHRPSWPAPLDPKAVRAHPRPRR